MKPHPLPSTIKTIPVMPTPPPPTTTPTPSSATTPSPSATVTQRKSKPCPRCGQPCLRGDRSLVRALGEVYHYDCFVCEDCHRLVAEKFYAFEVKQKRRVVCEQHYYVRLGLACQQCHQPQRRNCRETCTSDAGYEFNGQSYCRLHFSMLRGTQCAGCGQAVLKQFVEHKENTDKRWHPECYMIYKFWNVRMDNCLPSLPSLRLLNLGGLPDDDSNLPLERIQAAMEQKVNRVWTDLSAFEESSATCISDMLLHVAAGAYLEGLRMANQFVMHLEVLFAALDTIRSLLFEHDQVMLCDMESEIVCKQVMRFFHLLAQNDNENMDKKDALGVTQELLSLVTGLAQNLKTLIRIGLTEALRLERYYAVNDAISLFLEHLLELEKKRVWMAGRYWFSDLVAPHAGTAAHKEQCPACDSIVNSECYECDYGVWHATCFVCTQCQCRLQPTSVFWGGKQGPMCAQCGNGFPKKHVRHVSQLGRQLECVKMTLARMSIPDGLLQEYDAKINRDTIGKRNQPSSLLRMLATGRPSSSTSERRRQSLFGSVHFSSVKRTRSSQLDRIKETPDDDVTDVPPAHVKRSQTVHHTPGKLTISGMPSPTRGTMSTRDTSATSGIGGSLRRAFTHRRDKRGSLTGVFDRQRRLSEFRGQRAQRASIFALETSPETAAPSSMRLIELAPAQDFIVRHVAALCMEHHVHGLFSFENLVGLVESKKTTIWGKIKTIYSKEISISRTFGVPLSVLVARDQQEYQHLQKTQPRRHSTQSLEATLDASWFEHAHIPRFVQSCISALLHMDLTVEGVFRKNGNIRELKQMCERINADNRSMAYCEESSPIQLAALLKRFLRELPEPLLTFKLHALFLASMEMKSEAQMKHVLHLACCMLPKPNRDTMNLLFLFLKRVASLSDANKMDISNLARVIAPSVLYARASSREDTQQRQQCAQDEIRVVEMLIQYQEEFCMVPPDVIPWLQDTQMTDYLNQYGVDLSSKHFLKTLNGPPPSPTPTATRSTALPSPTKSVDPKLLIVPQPSTTTQRKSWIPRRH